MKSVKIKDPEFPVAPSKLNLWLIMVASAMLFTAIMSAYIVQRPDAEQSMAWTAFDLPIYFFYSFIIAILSSLTIQISLNKAKQDEIEKNRIWLFLTLILGLLFCISQFLGWKQMVSLDLTFVNSRPEDISASYVYVITAVHILHVFGGIILLSISYIKSLQLKIHKKSLTFMSITNTYWHFVGLLWFFLYLFLYFAK